MTSVEIILFVFAWLLIIVGVALVLRTKAVIKWLKFLVEETEDLFGMGFWTLILGLLVLGIAGPKISWTGTDWIVPVLGWIATIKGTLLVVWPDAFKPMVKPFYKNPGMMMAAGVIALALGIWMVAAF
jgi:hypothetical protein